MLSVFSQRKGFDMPHYRALVGVDSDEAGDSIVGKQIRNVEALLLKMGYEVDIQFLIEGSTWLAEFERVDWGYDFIVFFKGTFGWNASDVGQVILTGEAIIPTFCMGLSLTDTNSTIRSIGVNRVATASNKVVTHKRHSTQFKYVVNTFQYEVAPTRVNDITILTEVDDPAASTYTVFNQAKLKGTNTTVYVDVGSGSSANFPMLYQEALNDGLVPRPRYRLQGAFDIDDYPDSTNTLADLEATYAIQEQFNLPITYGIISDTGSIGNVDQSLYDFIAARQPNKGGLIYPIDHAGSDFWDSAYATIESNYQTSLTNMRSVGLRCGDNAPLYDNSWGYRFFNNNAVNGDGARIAEKYNFGVLRLANGIKSSGVTDKWLGTPTTTNNLAGHVFSIHRGMLLCGSGSFMGTGDISLDITTDASTFAPSLNHWFLSLSDLLIPFVHGSNFYDAHDSGNAPGNVLLRQIGHCSQWMKDIVDFVHPSAFMEQYTRHNKIETDNQEGFI